MNSFVTWLPSSITLLGLSAGLSGLRAATLGEWEQAVMFVLLAALCDGLDGRVARYFKVSSEFGAQLDSLTDSICFGVTPALILYLWGLQEASAWSWLAVLFFILSCVLRLARFNLSQGTAPGAVTPPRFFVGLASPVGALLLLTPMMLHFSGLGHWLRSPLLLVFCLLGVGVLMISRIPTLSIKHLSLREHPMFWGLLALALFWAFALGKAFWLTLALTLFAYLLSIPAGTWYAQFVRSR